MRKIIQIQLSPVGKIIALADDGTLWVKEDEWFMIKPLPQKTALPPQNAATDESSPVKTVKEKES